MSVNYYDDALAAKIQSWINVPGLQVLKPDATKRLFQTKAQQANDKPLTLPLIALSRGKEIEILDITKQPKTYDGLAIAQTEERTILMNAIPIQLTYQVDIYARYIEEADEFLREFIFNFVNYPKLVIEVPYNDCDVSHTSTIYLNNTVEDNSDIAEHLFYDQFTRYTIQLTIDDAYLFNLPIKQNARIQSAELQVHDRTDYEIVEKEKIM